MIRKILSRVLRRQAAVTRCVGQFSQGKLRARVLETESRDGALEYWIDVQWETDGDTCSSIGLLRRTTREFHFDVLRESQSYLRTLTR